MATQTISYYKDATRSTRFIKETGELLHIFNNNPELSLSIQIIDESQRDIMVSSLASHAELSTAEEFTAVLDMAKTKVNNL